MGKFNRDLNAFHFKSSIEHVLFIDTLIDVATKIVYVDDSDKWTYEQQVDYLMKVRLGLNTSPIAYYMDDDNVLYILKGYNQFITLKDYYETHLIFKESDVYDSESDELVCYDTTKNYNERATFNRMKIHMLSLSGFDEKIKEYGIENITETLKIS